jgi:hypothetical protein
MAIKNLKDLFLRQVIIKLRRQKIKIKNKFSVK